MTERARAVRQSLAAAFPGATRLLASTAARRIGRAALWAFWIVYFGFVALVLALRYSILPNIETHRPAIERLASRALGQTVNIGRIEASWDGINPDLDLFDVRVLDAEGRPALAFSRIEAILSWLSVPSGTLKLRLLRIDQPTLNLRRDAAGQFFIAGIPLAGNDEASGSAFADWVFAQRRIRIRDATLVWDDDLRQAPTLRLEALNFGLDNFGWRRRFGLTARPPAELASHIDVRGDFSGNEIDRLDDWTGEAFAQVDYVDLAAWRPWVDYPLTLSRGRGALRLWAGIEDGALREMTADLLLREVDMRLHKDLPALALAEASGRIAWHRAENGLTVSGSRLALSASGAGMRAGEGNAASEAGAEKRGGIVRIEPMDFHLVWNTDAQGQNTSGSLIANRADLGAMNRLTAYLPLAADVRRFLDTYQPDGQLSDLDARWQGDAITGEVRTYGLKGRFSQLAINARDAQPGFSGLSGEMEVSEKGGSLTLDSARARLDLPGVFPVPRTELETLTARARWTLGKDGLAVELPQLEFTNAEVAGNAAGVYRRQGEGPGNIDLKAALTRADARAVWRYIPHAVSDATRHWLRDSLISGKAGEARLTLKGDLADFPFLDTRKGQFLVTVKAEDVTLDYADGWPRIEGIYGNLRFERERMVVDVQRGTILGAKLGATRAEIPDLGLETPVIDIKGQAEGPTAEFLKFIDQSPVAGRIDRFTEGMRASGNGRLDIALNIPLDEKQLDAAKVKGEYRFQNNTVSVDAALPPLRQVNGAIQFSGSELNLPEIRANLFGGPLSIKGGLQADGRVLITLNGTANVEALRQAAQPQAGARARQKAGQPAARGAENANDAGNAGVAETAVAAGAAEASPLLAHLSGATAYHGEVRIQKRDADLVIDSTLAGLASTLPAPFNKAAGETLPLHFEKRLLAAAPDGAARDQLTASLGQKLAFQAVRRKQGGNFVVERAALGIGRAQALPARGFAVGISAPRLDLDVWRALLAPGGAAEAEARQGSVSGFTPDTLSLSAPELRAFGRTLNDVALNAESADGLWQLHLDSRQIRGDLRWDGRGRGKLTARLKRLLVDPEDGGDAVTAEEKAAMKELPSLDIVAEDFRFGARRFGRLELQAVNAGEAWDLSAVKMNAPHGVLTGAGQWKMTPGHGRTHLDFTLESDDAGKLLDQLGYAGMVSGGAAKLAGQLEWPGAPTGFELAALDGHLTLEAGRGQFLKVQPGAGRLLGLISLQSLPRRISLDFRDVFSEGFAFDSISSALSLKGGVMRADRLQIDGPAARVLMRGETDLKHETQRLFVTVQPELSATAALGVALVNPVAGAATLLASKVLKDPLNQIFSFDYLVTGVWDDPKVERLSRQEAQSALGAPPGATDAATSPAPAAPAAASGANADPTDGRASGESIGAAASGAPTPSTIPTPAPTETKNDAAYE